MVKIEAAEAEILLLSCMVKTKKRKMHERHRSHHTETSSTPCDKYCHLGVSLP